MYAQNNLDNKVKDISKKYGFNCQLEQRFSKQEHDGPHNYWNGVGIFVCEKKVQHFLDESPKQNSV